MTKPNGADLIDPDKYLYSLRLVAEAFVDLENFIGPIGKFRTDHSFVVKIAKDLNEKLIEMFANEIDILVRQYSSFLVDLEDRSKNYESIPEDPDDEAFKRINVEAPEITVISIASQSLSLKLKEYIEEVNNATEYSELPHPEYIVEQIHDIVEQLRIIDSDYPELLSASASIASANLISLYEDPVVLKLQQGLETD